MWCRIGALATGLGEGRDAPWRWQPERPLAPNQPVGLLASFAALFLVRVFTALSAACCL